MIDTHDFTEIIEKANDMFKNSQFFLSDSKKAPYCSAPSNVYRRSNHFENISILLIFVSMIFIQGCSYRSLGRKAFETRMENDPPKNLSVMSCQTRDLTAESAGWTPSSVEEFTLSGFTEGLNDSSNSILQYEDERFKIMSHQKSPTNVQISVTEQLPNLIKTCFYNWNSESNSPMQFDSVLLNNLMRWTEAIENPK